MTSALRALNRPGTRRVVGIAAVVLVVGALAWTLIDGWSTVTAYDWQLKPAWLAGAAAVLALAYTVAAEAYARVVAELHPPAHTARGTLRRHWSLSLLGRYVPGNVLMVAGRMELGRDAGVPRRVALAASTYEQILMLGASALGGLGFLAAYGDLERGAALWVVGAVPLLIVILHPRVMRKVSGTLLRKLGREPLPAVLTGRQTSGLFLLYLVVQASVGLGAAMIVQGTAGDAAGIVFVGLAFQLAFALSMIAFIFPAGLGIRDGIFALALAQELPTEIAVAAAVLVRLAMTIFEIGYVAAMASLARRRG